MTTAPPEAAAAPPSEIYGTGLDRDHYEVVMIQHIDRKLAQAEAGLYARKWFDYRNLHPVEATYLMVHHYHRAYGDFVGRALSHKRRYVKAFKGKDFLQTHERKSFWRLRQKIDELGIRYEFFLRFAMNWNLARGWGKGAAHPPRPCHLTNNDELIVDVANAWALECRGKIQFITAQRYTVAQWVASPDQLAYEAFVVESIKAKPHPRFALHAALYLYDALRIETALENFPAQAVVDAADICLQTDK